MIVTVTPSPAIDWTVAVDSFELDAVNRITTSTREASGKGINVSWALHRAGVDTTAVFPGGGQTGEFMESVLTGAAMPFARVDTGREVRTNVTLVSPGHSTKINEPGVAIDGVHIDALIQRVVDIAAGAKAVLTCGSLPSSMGSEKLNELINRIQGSGTHIVVDTSGEALFETVQSGPDLIKPNVHELAELVSKPISTFDEVALAAREVIDRGVKAVLASLGADGAMYVDKEQILIAKAWEIPFVNSVGAGDALLSGFFAVDSGPSERLHNAVLWASSAVAHHSTLFPILPEFSQRVTVQEFTSGLAALSEPALV